MDKKEFETYNAEGVLSKDAISSRLSFGKLTFLAVVSMLLCTVGPLSLFASLPLAVGFLLYGYKKTFVSITLVIALVVAVALNIPALNSIIYTPGIYLLAVFYAFVSSRIIVKGEHPVSGMIKSGGVALGLLVVLVVGLVLGSEQPIYELARTQVEKSFTTVKNSPDYNSIIKAGGAQARLLADLVKNPEEVTKLILSWTFPAAFVTVFFGLWLSLFLLLRNSILWKVLYDYPYRVKDLTSFKVPDQFVFILIAGLGLTAYGQLMSEEVVKIVGMNILYCMGVFYFFQGFGVLLDYLTHVGIRGFFRSIIIITVLFLAVKIVAFVGVFDLWFDFRKYFKKKEMNKEI